MSVFLLKLFLFFHFHFPSTFVHSRAEYTLPDKYFINCGSDSTVSFGGSRYFVGDVKLSSLPMISPGESEVVKENSISKSIPEIYHTARVYKRPTWYFFDNINRKGTYIVRLHFFPLSSKTYPDLSQARFNIWVSSMYRLLSNYSLENSLEKVPVVKEFVFEIKKGRFGIHFSPSMGSSLAFVNAIEVFLAPEKFKPDEAYPISPESRSNSTGALLDASRGNTNYDAFKVFNMTDSISYNLGSVAFQAIYRINIGGSLLTPDNDTLWRTWMPDDGFLAVPAAAAINVHYQGEIKYGVVTTKYTAPSFVYKTAKELNLDKELEHPKFSNITWVFTVKKKAKYFIRLHWCYLDKKGDGRSLFDFFIGSNRTSFHVVFVVGVPVRLEMVIVTDSSGFLNIGIARNKGSKIASAFLNGLEIMELIEKSDSMEFIQNSDSSPVPKLQKDKKLLYLLIGAVVGGVVAISLVFGLLLFYCKVRKSKQSPRMYQEFLSHEKHSKKISISDLAPNLNLDLKIPFSEIQIATNDFNDEKVIGVGGFGKVYLGTLRDKKVAVKRSRPGFGQGLHEFQTEIIVLSQIRHRHLVSLYGYCDENGEMILVYEFMEKGTLREYLYGSNNNSLPLLSWNQRIEICIDAAKGLDYLHTSSVGGGIIIHRDIKTTNILLDKDYKAKVGDFGISKSDPNKLDTTIKGTYGYLDPEYFNTGILTEKSDVYSFGVVLLEVLSARPPIVQSLPDKQVNLAEWSILCIKKGEIEKLIDPFLAIGTIELNSLQKFIDIAEKCLHEFMAERPSMHQVAYELELALQFQNINTAIVDCDSTTLRENDFSTQD